VENAHGKAPLCRAPENMRTAKIETHGNHRFSRKTGAEDPSDV
jgi:hypothetical protein